MNRVSESRRWISESREVMPETTSGMSAEHEDLRPYVGPTPYCNWVIKDRLMAGGYPACLDDKENDELLRVLLGDLGIDTFVCLQSEVRPEATEQMWRTGRCPRPYTRDIRRRTSCRTKR